MVDQAARCRHQNFRIARQQLHLFRIRHATQDRYCLDAAHMGAVFVSGSRDLQGQFTRWCQHQHLRLCSAEARTIATGACSLGFLIWCLGASRCRRQRGKFVQRWQHESRCLARASLRRNQQILTCDGSRNSLFLYRCWLGITSVSQGFDNGRVQAECFKSHVFFRYIYERQTNAMQRSDCGIGNARSANAVNAKKQRQPTK